jgi:formate dehydrogenase iron-sulfur subunit
VDLFEEVFRETAAERETATYEAPPGRKGFFTDTTLCIGCKACEVACKEWNRLPADGYAFTAHSYDNTGELNGTTWRHVAFVEQLGQNRWLMESDVCKHCTHAACLNVCPTGSLFRTEFGTVVVQEDICNGCGYCVPACPYGVIDKRETDGHAGKCTLCYDRLRAGETPACAKACPTESIQYGDLEELQRRADARVEALRTEGRFEHVQLYGRDQTDGVGGTGALFLLLDKPEVYGFPPDPVDPTRDLGACWRAAGYAMATLVGATMLLALGKRR